MGRCDGLGAVGSAVGRRVGYHLDVWYIVGCCVGAMVGWNFRPMVGRKVGSAVGIGGSIDSTLTT